MQRISLPTALLLIAASLLFSSCLDRKEAKTKPLTIEVAQGMSAEEISARWKTPVVKMDSSFELLVSKNLHPYQLPPGNELLRFDKAYLVLEFADGKLIAIHKVRG